jgi:hypothetical protein
MDGVATQSTLLIEHHSVTSLHRLAKLGGQRSMFVPTIGFAGLLCSG